MNTMKDTSEEYNDRDYDYYNDTIEFFWAARQLGFNVNWECYEDCNDNRGQ